MANEVLIGYPPGDHVRIRVLRRSHPGASDYWDGNWLDSEALVASGHFQGRFLASLRSDELDRFRRQIQQLYETLAGNAELTTMEHQIEITLAGDGKGHVAVAGIAVDRAGIGNRLTFSFEIDRTYLPMILTSLDSIVAVFPVLGIPDA